MNSRMIGAAAVASLLLLAASPALCEVVPGVAPTAKADNAASEALARRYLVAMGFEKNMDTMMAALLPMFVENASKQYPSITPEERAQFVEIVRRVMRDEFTSKLLDRIVPVYAAAFKPSELEAIVAFYESPAGQAMTDKMPSLAPKVTEITRDMMPELQREVVRQACQQFNCFQQAPKVKPTAS